MLVSKKGFVLLIGLLFMFSLSACSSDTEANNDPKPTVIATVNNENIYESTWQKSVDRMLEGYKQQGLDIESEQGQMFVEQIKTQALEQLIQRTVLYQEAKATGFAVETSTAQAELDQLKSNYASDEVFKEALETNMFTENELLEMLELELSINAYFDANIETMQVTDLEKIEFYQDYKAHAESEGQSVQSYSELEAQIEAQIISDNEQEQVSNILNTLIESSDIERFI